jgi:ketosteroid isomerase-like protein
MVIDSAPSTAEAVIRKYFEAVDQNAILELLDCFSDDVIYERPGYPPICGRSKLRSFYETERIIASGKHVIEGLIVRNAAAACWGRFDGTRRDGTPITARFADIYEMNDAGRISHRITHFFAPFC